MGIARQSVINRCASTIPAHPSTAQRSHITFRNDVLLSTIAPPPPSFASSIAHSLLNSFAAAGPARLNLSVVALTTALASDPGNSFGLASMMDSVASSAALRRIHVPLISSIAPTKQSRPRRNTLLPALFREGRRSRYLPPG